MLYRRIIDTMVRDHMLDLWRAINLTSMVLQARHVPGAVVEFGTYKGASALLLTYLSDKPVYLYDSFEGLPPSRPDEGNLGFGAGELRSNPEDVLTNFRDFGFREPTICKKWFADVTAEDLPDAIAFAHLDTDLYDSTYQALERVYPRMSAGALAVIDDYEWVALPGVKRACDAFFADKPEAAQHLPPSDYPHAYFIKSGTVAPQSAPVPAAQTMERTERFVLAGSHRINVDKILYTSEEKGALVVVFGSGRLKLKGDEAEVVRRALR